MAVDGVLFQLGQVRSVSLLVVQFRRFYRSSSSKRGLISNLLELTSDLWWVVKIESQILVLQYVGVTSPVWSSVLSWVPLAYGPSIHQCGISVLYMYHTKGSTIRMKKLCEEAMWWLFVHLADPPKSKARKEFPYSLHVAFGFWIKIRRHVLRAHGMLWQCLFTFQSEESCCYNRVWRERNSDGRHLLQPWFRQQKTW